MQAPSHLIPGTRIPTVWSRSACEQVANWQQLTKHRLDVLTSRNEVRSGILYWLGMCQRFSCTIQQRVAVVNAADDECMDQCCGHVNRWRHLNRTELVVARSRRVLGVLSTLPHLQQPVRPESERRTAIRQTVPKKASVETETSTLI